jgi:hypothetical protein
MATPFKRSLTLLLRSYVDTQKPLHLSWTCTYCRVKHSANLLENVAGIENKVVSDDLNADIGLMTADGQLLSAVHISKNKRPIANAVAHYQTHNIDYIQVTPNDDPLTSLERPLYVGTCLNPKCEKCGGYQQEKNLLIIDSKCWKCNGGMNVAVLECSGYHGGPDRFTEDELSIARGKGAIIANSFSKTVGHSYLSNTCPHCQMLSGNHFLFDHYDAANMATITMSGFH